jgi:GTP cyclohydrolase II
MSTDYPQFPPIIILSYVAESDVTYAPDHEHVESRHRQIWQYFNTGDVFRARIKACRTAQQEIERLAEHIHGFADHRSPYQGIKLYFEYRINDRKGKKVKTYRFYLLDGDAVTRTELLERMEQETMFLVDAGNIFERVEVEDEEGTVFRVVADDIV